MTGTVDSASYLSFSGYHIYVNAAGPWQPPGNGAASTGRRCDGLRVLPVCDRGVEAWLRKDVAAAYDKLRSDPSRTVAAKAVKVRAWATARQNGRTRA